VANKGCFRQEDVLRRCSQTLQERPDSVAVFMRILKIAIDGAFPRLMPDRTQASSQLPGAVTKTVPLNRIGMNPLCVRAGPSHERRLAIVRYASNSQGLVATCIAR
jgi:hypothetical protein